MAVLTELPAEIIHRILELSIYKPKHASRLSVYSFACAFPCYEPIAISLVKQGEHCWFDNASKAYIPPQMSIDDFVQITGAEIDRLRASGIHQYDCIAAVDRLRLRLWWLWSERRAVLLREEERSDESHASGEGEDEILRGYRTQANILSQISHWLHECIAFGFAGLSNASPTSPLTLKVGKIID